MLAGHGDLLPVSALPVDGTFPTDTARWERRSIAREIPIWDPAICIDCAKCALVCPHSAIRMKVFEPGAAATAPDTFEHKDWKDRERPGRWMTIQDWLAPWRHSIAASAGASGLCPISRTSKPALAA